MFPLASSVVTSTGSNHEQKSHRTPYQCTPNGRERGVLVVNANGTAAVVLRYRFHQHTKVLEILVTFVSENRK